MRKSRFTDEQMVKILREADAAPVSEVARRHRVSEQTLSVWRKRFGTMTASRVGLQLRIPEGHVASWRAGPALIRKRTRT